MSQIFDWKDAWLDKDNEYFAYDETNDLGIKENQEFVQANSQPEEKEKVDEGDIPRGITFNAEQAKRAKSASKAVTTVLAVAAIGTVGVASGVVGAVGGDSGYSADIAELVTTDSAIYYQIQIDDFDADADYCVVVYNSNGNISRTEFVTEEVFYGVQEDLPSNVTFTVEVKSGTDVLDKQTIRTLKEGQNPSDPGNARRP